MRRPSALTLLTAALLVLLPMLAVLQYRWVGQVSEAERERMQTHLRNASQQFRETLDGEIGRAFVSLQVGAATARDGSSDRYTDRYDTWLSTAAHPQIVADVFFVDADGARLRLRRWNSITHLLEASAWPEALTAMRPQFERQRAAFGTGDSVDWSASGPLSESILFAPLRPPPGPPGQPAELVTPLFGFTVVQLNLDYIRTELLPELSARYFTVNGPGGYRVAVVSRENPKKVIYRSDEEAPLEAARADAAEPLFGIRADFLFFNRAGNGGPDNQRSVILNVFRGRDGDFRGPDGRDGPRGVRIFDRDFGRWMLLARHQTGSLETAVTQARRRNLGISFGILLLLSFSVAMLAISSRRAQRLASQQMEFVAGISHELRTPVAVIRSAAENLAQGVVATPERVKRYGDTIGAQARSLGEMVERVLQFAGLESGRELGARTAVAPALLVHEAIESTAPLVDSAAVTIDEEIASDLPLVVGDPAALRSAVQNLVANAIKYGGDDRWVGVRVTRVGEGRRAEVRIAVEDHGAGVAAADLPHIFDPFYRGADAIDRQIHGNGLGLSIVRRIVAAHGGRVMVSSRPHEGSTFTIVLPASAHAAVPESAAHHDSMSPGASPLGGHGGAAAHS